jgi:hypothetical protein
MTNYEKAVVKVSDIKTNYNQPENSKEFLFTLGVLLKTIFPLVTVVVHKDTMQLIANGDYLQLAIQEGKDEIEVVLADFPEEYLLHAIATHWKPTKKYSVMFKFIDVFMKYYTKKNGIGAKFRDEDNPNSLRELVAEILGTNRTYLDMIEAIGNFKLELLEQVDNGEVSLKEAFAMVPKEKKSGKENKGNKGNKEQKKNHIDPVTDLSRLTKDEIEALTTNLPLFQAEQIGNGILPKGLSISKNFTNNDVFQGFSVVYEKDGKSVIIHIVYTDDFRSSLMAA